MTNIVVISLRESYRADDNFPWGQRIALAVLQEERKGYFQVHAKG